VRSNGRTNGVYSSKDYPATLRRVVVKDETGKRVTFLTNNFALKPEMIAALYKQRWQVELFFKWTKQHLRIKAFLGTSENAMKTQIWIAVCTYVLIAIVKKSLHLLTTFTNSTNPESDHVLKQQQ
jgi:IS4 transposase